MVEDDGAVPVTDVVALAVERRGIVHDEEDLQDVVERDDSRVVGQLDDFGMSSCACVDLRASRVLCMSAGIAGRDCFDAFYLAVECIEAPVAATADSCCFTHTPIITRKQTTVYRGQFTVKGRGVSVDCELYTVNCPRLML